MNHSTFLEGYFSVYLPTAVRGVIVFVFSLALASFFTLLSSLPVHAANGTNNQINYQGKLLDSTGAVVANGTYSIKFSIYDSATSGNRLWTATGTTATPIALSVTVQSGLFTILLGDNSTGTSQQNALDNTINWNSDTLYLGITIGSDSEMTPRKRLSSAPYAFNAERLQGMYASSSVFATSSLFVINQTSNTAATGTRSALEIRSSGTSTPYDFLLRGVNDQSDAVFTVNRLGSVTTTGNFALGDGTSDLITVNGRFNADLVPATDLTYSFGTASLRWNAILGNVTSSAVTTTSAYVSGTASTTLLFANSATFGTSTIAGKGVCLSDGSFCSSGAGSDTLATVTNRGSSATATLLLYGGYLSSSSTVTSTFTVLGGTSLQHATFTSATGTSFSLTGRVNSNLLPQTDLAYSLGSTSLRWNGAFGHVTATTVTTTNLYASNLSVNHFSSLNVTTTNLSVSGTVSLAYSSGTDLGLTASVTLPADETVVDLVASDRHVYALEQGGVIRVWDVTNPGAPTTTVTSSAFGAESMALEGRYLYINSGASGFQIFDITSADRPFVVGSSTESFAGERTFVRGGYMFIGNNIYDVHDPRSIDLVATTINAVTFFTDGFLQGKVYFQVRSSGSSELQMWDVSDPYRPVVIASAALAYTPDQITVQGGYAYIGVSGSDEIHVYDIGNLENVYEVTTFTGDGEMQAAGRYLYTDGLQIFDISNPLSPRLVKVSPVPGDPFVVSGRYAYLAENGVTDYFHVIDLGGVETPALSTALAEIGYLQVRTDGRVGGNLVITGSLNVGAGGVQVDGPFMVNASNTTSSVAGSIAFERNATVGTSTYTDQLHSLFAMSGDDLFVAGNIGSVSSVYTNGAFIAGTGTTMFGDGFIHKTNGNMSLSSSGGYYLPASDLGTRLGSASLRFHGYFGNTTSTNVTTTALWADSFRATSGTVTTLAGTTLYGGTSVFDNATATSLFATSFRATSGTVTSLASANHFWGNATGTGVTTTYAYFGTTASTTNFFANGATLGGLVVSGTTVCLSSGAGCGAGVEADTLATVTARGSSATATLQLLGGFITSSSTVTSTLTTVPGGTFTPVGMVDLLGSSKVIVSDGYAYVVEASNARISIIDIHDPKRPSSTATIATGGSSVGDAFVIGRTLYVVISSPNQLKVYDITNPTSPALQSVTTIRANGDIFVSGRYAYITGNDRLEILDIADTFRPTSVAAVVTSTLSRVYVSGDLAFVTQTLNGLLIFDVSEPTRPTLLSKYVETGIGIADVKVSGAYAYVTTQLGLLVLDISNPSGPVLKTSISASNSAGISLAGNYAFVARNTGVSIFDISTPGNVTQIAFSSATTSVTDIQAVGRYAYLAAQSDFSVFDIGGIQTHAAHIGSLFSSTLQVTDDVQIGNQLHVGSALQVGEGGILSLGSLAISATKTTSSFAGSLMVGTTTIGVAMNSLFVMNGSDLFVADNIGAASSVYTNGAFVAGAGSTYFGNGFISNNSASFTISTVSSTQFVGDIYNLYTTSSHLTFVTSTSIGSVVRPRLTVQGEFVYTVSSNTLRIISVLDPASPSSTSVNVGTSTTELTRVLVAGRYAFAFDRAAQAMYVVDIIDSRGAFVAATYTGMVANDAVLAGKTIYTSEGAGFGAIDISNPLRIAMSSASVGAATDRLAFRNNVVFTWSISPNSIRGYEYLDPLTIGSTHSLSVSDALVDTSVGSDVSMETNDNYIFVFAHATSSNSRNTLNVFSLENALASVTSVQVGSFTASTSGMTIRGRYLYIVGGDQNLYVYDVLDPARPSPVFQASLGGQVPYDIEISGRYLYVVNDGDNTLKVYRLPGVETPTFYSGSAEFGSVFLRDDLRVGHRVFADGGVVVGGSGIISQGGVGAMVNSQRTGSYFVNTYGGTVDRSWGAYINTLSVGTSTNATGTQHYSMVLSYSSTSRSGLCIDDIDTAAKCPSQVGYSLVADGPIGASGFDLAERYASTGTVASGDLVSLASSATATVMRSSGIPYDPKLIGIISSSPGFTLGIYDGEQVALTGRVPTKVSTVNGPIRIGDPLTSSQYPGVAMKATKPGMIVGYALDDADTTSTIEVFVDVGYNAGAILATDGTISEVRDNLVFAATAIASSTSPAVDSFGLTFRGSAYNTSTSELSTPSFTLLTDVQSSASSVFAFRNASGTNVASLTEQGDLSIAGRLFLSARGTPQDQFYMYLDDSLAPTSSYIATNANGFQANSSYDLAERYYSPDNLEPGDLVMIRPEGQIHVQRTSEEEHVVIGIVSTQPGFVLGAHTTSSYPIALAGRVPTKVSTMNGSIKAGDAVGPSSIPGVAVKATSGGPIVGYALEAYDAPDVGKVEVFLSAQAALASSEQETPQPAVLGATTSNDSPGGFATIQSGATRVHVSYESIGAYPKVFVTPATEAGDWWTEDYSDTGFDIVISSVLPRDVLFGWEVRPLMAGSQLFSSDNTYQALDPLTGQIIPTMQEGPEVAVDEEDVPIEETSAEDIGSASSTEPTS